MRGDAPIVLEPVRDTGATLVELLDVVLDKGVVLHLDLMISVADIPLVGVSLRAALAGIDTMLAHGMMNQWDAKTRAWIQRSIARDVPLETGEPVRLRMLASIKLGAPGAAWQAGVLYVTDRRVLVWRREPRAVLWEVKRADLAGARERGDGRAPLRLELVANSGAVLLSPADPKALLAELAIPLIDADGRADASLRLRLWYFHAASRTWRPGEATLRDGTLEWRTHAGASPLLSLPLAGVTAVRLDAPHVAVGDVVTLRHPSGEARFGGAVQPLISAMTRTLACR